MPHASYPDIAPPGLQAIILCGPGSSFPTFTVGETPKALLPVANRPMVWYPIDFCYRMGITNITIITPPSSEVALTKAFNINPHLTNLDLSKPILAPKDLTLTTGTAQILRLPEVQAIIKGDFVILPCDLVCDFEGQRLLEVWMRSNIGIGDATGAGADSNGFDEETHRKGGLGVWYDTKGETVIKGEETDFIATAPLESSIIPPAKKSIASYVSNLVYSLPTDTLKDVTTSKNSLAIRHGLLRAHPRIKMRSSHRDAHIYIFPRWVVDMVNSNEHMDSIGEDVIGWWAKAEWQVGLANKLGFEDGFNLAASAHADDSSSDHTSRNDGEFHSKSSTWTSDLQNSLPSQNAKPDVPRFLAYIHPKSPESGAAQLIRRVDTAPLLLSVSLQLAKLEAIDTAGRDAAPFAHSSKVIYPEGIAQRTTVTRPDCLLAENVKVEEKCSIKECVVGANCHIKEGAKLVKCVLMEGVVVGKGCKLNGCILGRNSVIGQDSRID
ncbi:Nucleotide-diphospho-sugar transferase [Glarea lozoyensis ATCC 20868]|uniref:Translation initiation factor eIF2B subunit gamma n=1 Tax=Glarea lozoyensis (strain ATCC 20868 / MF5171) TaxID=1116229 RepID=S3D3T2_GLAL2|nr:Nucleotide-diphospho-sugar transferase [Glarea lozoyensis ATCC 20868]EPE33137.1 Nucleotide-diphospho-sugar transferase [Glarea lozoyensis ATCC 20868]